MFSKDKLGNFVVRALQEGSCALASGICPGDAIVSVDGAPTAGMSMRQVAAAISGEVGSQVVLVIRRGSQSGNVTLERMAGLSKGAVSSKDQGAESAAQPSPTASSSIADSLPPSERATDSITNSSPPSDRNQEIMAVICNSFSEDAPRVSLQDLGRLPAPAATRSSDVPSSTDHGAASVRIKRLSKEFERSQLFLDIKDPKTLNAIVTADCKHLIDNLASPAAFEDARQRLIASRSRLPIADMKKVNLRAYFIGFFLSLLLLLPHPPIPPLNPSPLPPACRSPIWDH